MSKSLIVIAGLLITVQFANVKPKFHYRLSYDMWVTCREHGCPNTLKTKGWHGIGTYEVDLAARQLSTVKTVLWSYRTLRVAKPHDQRHHWPNGQSNKLRINGTENEFQRWLKNCFHIKLEKMENWNYYHNPMMLAGPKSVYILWNNQSSSLLQVGLTWEVGPEGPIMFLWALQPMGLTIGWVPRDLLVDQDSLTGPCKTQSVLGRPV